MNKSPCVFPKEENRGMGDRVFWFSKFDETVKFVRVFEHEDDEKYTIMVHESKIKPITKDMFEPKWGSLYLKAEHSQYK